MTVLILVFACATLLAGVSIVIQPEWIFGVLRARMESFWLQVVAVAVRLAIGILLVLQAEESRYPAVIEFIGWLSLVAALVFTVIGRRGFIAVMARAFSLLQPWGRIGGLFAMAFGGFLVYAFT